MGVDVSSHSGVIASTSEILKLVNGKNKKVIIEICQSFYDKLKKELDENKDCSWRKEVVEFFSPLDKIQAKTINDLKIILNSVVKINGEPSKYDLDTHVAYGEELCFLWNDIIYHAVDVDLPCLEEVTAFGSPRYNGWDVPLGEACFVFSEDSCFEKSLSNLGKNLKKVIGHASLTEWTHYSC